MGDSEIHVEYKRLKKLDTNFNIALLLNIFALGLVLLCCDLKYEVSDDFVMSTIVSGAYGKGVNPHLIFSNILIGYVLLPFYEFFPRISWYFVMHIAAIFMSSTVVTYILMERLERMKAVMLSSFLILFFSNDMYILVQFTKTAMFAVMAGSLFFLDALFYEKGRKRMIIGGALCIVGTWFRYSVIYMAGGFLILILIYEGIRLIHVTTDKRVLWKKIRKIMIGGCVLIGLAYGSNKIDSYIYRSNTDYAFFNNYGVARSRIVDFVDHGYEMYAEELQEIGVSENDYYMMKKWCFADNDFFSLERMQQAAEIIVSHNKELWRGWEDLIERVQDRKITNYPVFWANILLVFMGVFLNFEKVWTGVLANGVGWIYIIYFFIRDRLVYRIEFAVFLGVFLCGIYFWLKTDKEDLQPEVLRKSCFVIVVLVLAMRGIVYLPDRTYKNVIAENKKEYVEDTFFESWNYDARKYRKVVNRIEIQNGILEEIHNNKNNFYFLDFNTTIQNLYYEWSPWRTCDEGEYENYLYLAGVTSNFPDVIKLLEDREVEIPLKQLVDKDVYLIDNYYVELKVNYLREHYFPEARAELYKEIDGYQIWKIFEE
jgi:hypothetical protein